jgi:hypothetical protein
LLIGSDQRRTSRFGSVREPKIPCGRTRVRTRSSRDGHAILDQILKDREEGPAEVRAQGLYSSKLLKSRNSVVEFAVSAEGSILDGLDEARCVKDGICLVHTKFAHPDQHWSQRLDSIDPGVLIASDACNRDHEFFDVLSDSLDRDSAEGVGSKQTEVKGESQVIKHVVERHIKPEGQPASLTEECSAKLVERDLIQVDSGCLDFTILIEAGSAALASGGD